MSDRLSTTKTCVNDHDSSFVSPPAGSGSPRTTLPTSRTWRRPPRNSSSSLRPCQSTSFPVASRHRSLVHPASPGYRSSECGVINLQHMTSRDTHRGATSPLMSVDILTHSAPDRCRLGRDRVPPSPRRACWTGSIRTCTASSIELE